MSRIDLFLDSSALFAAVVSPTGAARALLELAECGVVTITVSEQVVAETERALARKVPAALPAYRQALRAVGLRIGRDPSLANVLACLDMISHPADAPILAAARQSQVDYLVTLNRRHFLDDPAVALRSGLRIGAPGEALKWIREQGLLGEQGD